MTINTGWTPVIPQTTRLKNMAAQLGKDATLGAVRASDGDLDVLEDIMTALLREKIATQGQDEGEKLARFFDKGAAASRQAQIDREQRALRQELTDASKTRADEIWQELAALDAEYQEIDSLLSDTYPEDDRRDAAMRSGKKG